MQEVEAVRNVNLVVLGLDPGELIHHLVAPLVHALVADVHLAIQDPEKAEAFDCKVLDRYIDDLLVAHRAVLEIELIV